MSEEKEEVFKFPSTPEECEAWWKENHTSVWNRVLQHLREGVGEMSTQEHLDHLAKELNVRHPKNLRKENFK